MKKMMLGAALAVGAAGLAAVPAHAAVRFGVYVGGPAAYVPPSPGPGYAWVNGYWAGGAWVPGYWNFVGVGPGYGFYAGAPYRHYDRDDFYRDRDDFYRDHDGYRDRDGYRDHHFDGGRDFDRGYDRDGGRGDHFRR